MVIMDIAILDPFCVVIFLILLIEAFRVLGWRISKKSKQRPRVIAKKCPKCGRLRGISYEYYTGPLRPAGELICGNCGFQGKASEFN